MNLYNKTKCDNKIIRDYLLKFTKDIDYIIEILEDDELQKLRKNGIVYCGAESENVNELYKNIEGLIDKVYNLGFKSGVELITQGLK